mmetsp:Transcript_8190/g.20441  ORF Transcript_8190/g.20441 Transcript_8190/m.20441 type:complete len:91 (+) Transcript_8190:150-422(+)
MLRKQTRHDDPSIFRFSILYEELQSSINWLLKPKWSAVGNGAVILAPNVSLEKTVQCFHDPQRPRAIQFLTAVRYTRAFAMERIRVLTSL